MQKQILKKKFPESYNQLKIGSCKSLYKPMRAGATQTSVYVYKHIDVCVYIFVLHILKISLKLWGFIPLISLKF